MGSWNRKICFPNWTETIVSVSDYLTSTADSNHLLYEISNTIDLSDLTYSLYGNVTFVTARDDLTTQDTLLAKFDLIFAANYNITAYIG